MLRVVEFKDGVVTVAGSYPYALFETFAIGTGRKVAAATVFDAAKGQARLFMHDQDFSVSLGMPARPLGHALAATLGKQLTGRVVDAFGKPLNGFETAGGVLLPVIRKAIPIIDRAAVERPLLTGTLALDWIIPIGRGQRQLIIGDAGTGKTQLALNMIVAQRDSDVVCIYVAIGQKAPDVAACHAKLLSFNAMKHTVVIASRASDNALSRFVAPLTGMTLAELWAGEGRDVLIVFDDLSRHAEAYRELSLLLQRPPGRESYPGDVFTLHASLLERSGSFVRKAGGGSITAVPIATTVDGEIAAFIPTNLISITDGQVSVSNELFLQNVRPAVDLGQSVSRIGGRAQSANVRSMSASLKVDISVYNDQKAFLQLTREAGLNANPRMAALAVLPELLMQGADEVVDRRTSVVLLALYQTGLLGGLRDVRQAITTVRRVIDSPWFARIMPSAGALDGSPADVTALVRAVFGPLLRAMGEQDGMVRGALAQVPSDTRLYEMVSAAGGMKG